ncbi:putative membrane protein [Streptacidiphilus sp. MAP12-33]|uniref:DoxX family protein n=1 Tax=Streptacidiphilus sp. MAP12-33 TaxID=3156266 RepID=UPI003519D113
MTDPRPAPSAAPLAALLAVAGAAHFLAPGPFDAIVPHALPGRARTWTYLSGAAELAVAATLAAPRTRRTGGLLAAGLFAAVLPANIQMALDWHDKAPALRAAAWSRVPLQVPLITRSLRIARG